MAGCDQYIPEARTYSRGVTVCPVLTGRTAKLILPGFFPESGATK